MTSHCRPRQSAIGMKWNSSILQILQIKPVCHKIENWRQVFVFYLIDNFRSWHSKTNLTHFSKHRRIIKSRKRGIGLWVNIWFTVSNYLHKKYLKYLNLCASSILSIYQLLLRQVKNAIKVLLGVLKSTYTNLFVDSF